MCVEYNVDYDLVKAVITTESNWKHKAKSTAGAIGLMQILPSTALCEFSTRIEDLYDPYVNVTVGIMYLSGLQKIMEFNRDKVYSDEVDKSLSFTSEIYNRYLTLSFRHPKKWTFGAIYDYISFDPSNPLGFNIDSKNDNFIESALRSLGVDLKNKWFGIEIVKDFNLHHQLTVFYGSESGGIRCANGVCSYQAPFVDGLKLTLRSIF